MKIEAKTNTTKPSLLILINGYHPKIGGAEKQAEMLASAFISRGWQVKVLTLRFKRELQKEELVNGILREESRAYFNEVAAQLKERGCDAMVLGCTEIPLLVDPDDCPLPTLDSTRLLARAAIRKALE